MDEDTRTIYKYTLNNNEVQKIKVPGSSPKILHVHEQDNQINIYG